VLKRIIFTNVRKGEGRWFPMSMVYKDTLKEGPGIKITIQELKPDTPIPASSFNLAKLK